MQAARPAAAVIEAQPCRSRNLSTDIDDPDAVQQASRQAPRGIPVRHQYVDVADMRDAMRRAPSELLFMDDEHHAAGMMMHFDVVR